MATRFLEARTFFGTDFRFTVALGFALFPGAARVAFALLVFALVGLRLAAERDEATRLLARDPDRLRLLVTALMEAQIEGKWSQNRSEDAVAE